MYFYYIRILFAILTIFVIGYILLRIIRRSKQKNFLEVVGLSFGLGIGSLSMSMFLLSYMHISLTLLNVLIFSIPFFVLFALAMLKVKIFDKMYTIKDEIKNLNWLELILLLLILLTLLCVFHNALVLPLIHGDEIGSWGYKAKILYHDASIYSNDFFDADRAIQCQHYPLLIPLVESWIYTVLGCVDERAVKVIFPIFFTALLFVIYTAQRKFFSRTHALLFTALLASLPNFVLIGHCSFAGTAISGYADVPLSFFYSVSTIYLYLWIKEHNRDYICIAAIFAAFAMFTKDEGIALFLINAMVLSLHTISNFKDTTKIKICHLLIYLIVPIVICMPWFMYKMEIPKTGGYRPESFAISIIIQNIHRIPTILTTFMTEFINLKQWNVLWVLLVVSTLFAVKETFKKPTVYLFLIILLQLSLFMLVFIVSPLDLALHMHKHLARFLILVAPVAIFLMSNQVYYGNLLPSLRIIKKV